jgi:glycosyltransferase involved in cell wall biosynthesis
LRLLVSVIIPTYNRSSLLKHAIQSVLDQTYSELECIVVDDASSDETRKVINSFEDNRLRYFRHEENIGASAARNTGIRHVQAELIAFLDDDDQWLSTKLEKQVPLLKGLPERFGMVYCWMDYYDANNKLIHQHHPTLKGYVFPQVLDAQRIGGCPTLLVKRKVLERIGGFDENLLRGNDADFIRRVCQKYEVDFVPEVLVKVHIGHGNKRLSDYTEEGIRNAIRTEEIKLKKFKNEFIENSDAHINVLNMLSKLWKKLGNFERARIFLEQIHEIDTPKSIKGRIYYNLPRIMKRLVYHTYSILNRIKIHFSNRGY